MSCCANVTRKGAMLSNLNHLMAKEHVADLTREAERARLAQRGRANDPSSGEARRVQKTLPRSRLVAIIAARLRPGPETR